MRGSSVNVGARVSVCLFVLLGASLLARATPGDLDTTYGAGGSASHDVPGYEFVNVYGSALQANGKLTIVGSCASGTPTPTTICALRLNANGIPDPSFGNDGRVVLTSLGSGAAYVVTYQDDGKLLLGTQCSAINQLSACLIRLLADGGLDSEFGSNGRVAVSVQGTRRSVGVFSVRLQRDGRITVGVRCVRNDSVGSFAFCAAQLHPDGVFDASFGSNGSALVEATAGMGTHQRLSSMALDSSGRWVLSGECWTPAERVAHCAARLHASGARDLSFGAQGAAVHSFSSSSRPAGDGNSPLVLLVDGSMVSSTSCNPSTSFSYVHACIAAFGPSGQLQASFANGGTLTYSAASVNIYVVSSALQHDGRWIVAAYCPSEGATNFCFFRLRSDGTLDPSLPLKVDSVSGRQYTGTSQIDAQGRLLLAGACDSSSPGRTDRFCVTRYQLDASANTMCSFDLDGDGFVTPRVDGLILLRAVLGFSANSILQGVSFPAGAKRTVWGGGGMNDLRQYLVAQCGMSIAPVAMTN